MTQLRLKMIQLWIMAQYACWKPYYTMLQEAYGRNEALDLVMGLYGDQIDEYVATVHESQGQLDAYIDEQFTYRQYLEDLSGALKHMEHVMDYMVNELKYVSTRWDPYRGRPKDEYLEQSTRDFESDDTVR